MQYIRRKIAGCYSCGIPGCNFECVPVEGIAFDTNVKVEVDFEKVILQDNEEDGTLTGEVKFILYKGDHYHLTVLSDWDENVFVIRTMYGMTVTV